MTSNRRYEQLIRKVQEYYIGFHPELHNISNGDELFDLEWFPPLTEEINLWTYWQGRGNLDTAEVIMLGQDFGSYKVDGKTQAFLLECLKANNSSKIFVEEINSSPNNWTDKNIIKLFSVLGNEFHADIANEKLFFTNLCLGYRTSEKGTQGNVSSQMKHDSLYIKELIDIIKPKVVICLGLDTFVSAATGINKNACQNMIKEARKNFYEILDKGKNHMTIKEKNYSYEIFAMGHPGFYGVINRKKNSEKKELTGIELMMEDWKKMKNYL